MTNLEYKGNKTDFYVASPETADVVNLAIFLKRPLLVEGEPGCGKTSLGKSVAKELGLGDVVKIPVKSTSRARDLLYRVNAIRRLQDAQQRENPNAAYLYPYLSLEPLGEAIRASRRQVVLIDEVDKADIDFPNDLLDVLEDFSFTIDDLPDEERAACEKHKGYGKTVTANQESPPIVIITSNREKRLPEPFLRRCLYIRLKFPDDPKILADIVRKNTQLTPAEWSNKILEAAIAAFLKVREKAVGNVQKPPSTSELIDWARILHLKNLSADAVAKAPLRPPHWERLFKTVDDLEAYGHLSQPKA